MAFHIRIAPSLHGSLPSEASVSAIVRSVINDAVANPEALISAFANRMSFNAPAEADKRYAIHISDAEREAGDLLAAQFNLSTNQMVQILLEDLMFRAGRWPVDKNAKQD